MPAGFVKYLPSARMDCTVPRFTAQYSRCVVSRDLLRFSWLSSDSVKCKVRPAYRASDIPAKTAGNTKTPRTMRPVNARCGVFILLCSFRQIHDPGG